MLFLRLYFGPIPQKNISTNITEDHPTGYAIATYFIEDQEH
jgi:hypothetical protein